MPLPLSTLYPIPYIAVLFFYSKIDVLSFTFSLLLVLLLVIVAVHRSLSFGGRINKRYYDSLDGNNDNIHGDHVKTLHIRHKGYKEDPCENKPLWFLKTQASLGTKSPYYNCLNDHGVERK